MATIIIGNVDDEVLERLRLQAQHRGLSVAQEAARLLTVGTQPTRAEIAVRAAAIRARQRPHRSGGVNIIRKDRSR